jgi:hypothetical protein
LVFYFTPCHAAWLTTNRPNTIALGCHLPKLPG